MRLLLNNPGARMKRAFGALVLLAALAGPALAVEPNEMLSDPKLEARARDLSKGLRCLVCRNETIDESNAGLARDVRLLLRERLVAGDTDGQAVQAIVDRYGDYVLLKPPFERATLMLWLGPPALLLLGGGIIAFAIRRRRTVPPPAPDALGEDEQRRVAELIQEFDH